MVARDRPCQRTLEGRRSQLAGVWWARRRSQVTEGPGRQSGLDLGSIQWATIAPAIVAAGWLGALVAILI